MRATLAQELKTVAGFEALHGRGADYEYKGPYDFVLREGTWFEPPTEPHGYQSGAPKLCFANSIHGVVLHGLRYVEGFAMTEYAPLGIHHAWNLDADGNVIDLTWGAWDNLTGKLVRPIGTAYCGIEFSVERADDATWNGDATILDDHIRSWPLFREKWSGEPADAIWDPSPRLDALRLWRDGDPTATHALIEAGIGV